MGAMGNLHAHHAAFIYLFTYLFIKLCKVTHQWRPANESIFNLTFCMDMI